jgi:S1-C subfamily serine protease
VNKIRSLPRGPLLSAALGGLIVGLLFWLALAVGLIEAPAAEPGGAEGSASPALATPVEDGEAMTAGEIYERSAPAVAFIEATGRTGPASPFDPFGGQRQRSSGSGFLIDDDGHVVTNAHVVAGADEVTVSIGENGDELEGEVLGADGSTDVAVLEVDSGAVDAEPLELGASDDVRVGDPVVAIGNPFGLDRTVTTGIISALQREITAPDGFTISDVIQTDASINPGNSGGPLIDASGQVIGVNSQIATAGGGGSVGVGFAVPVDTVRDVAEQLIDDGDVEHAFLGIAGADLEPQLARVLNLGIERGVIVQEVTEGGPADEAGLEGGDTPIEIGGQELLVGGDLITAIEGEELTSMAGLVAAVNRHSPGDEIEIEVFRDGETETLTVRLSDRPGEAGD